jgi:dTDP-glucose pyrophosphorylase/predicted transcriptional regulator
MVKKNMHIKKDWYKTVLTKDASIKDGIMSLTASSMQIILIIDENNILLGVINDGDIRRGILKGLAVDESINKVMNDNPLVVGEDVTSDSVIKMMSLNNFAAIPIVDINRCVLGLHLLNEMLLNEEKPNKIIIMSGGKGKRLMPKTKDCPKPLLKVNGKPMLEHIILKARDEGFHHFVLAIHYLGDMIKEYFGDGSSWGVEIEYLNEEQPLGTAGAISLMEERPKLPVIVTNADIISDITYSGLLDFHNQHQDAYATMAVRPHEIQHPFGIVSTSGVDIVSFEEKPIHRSNVNAGVYVLEPKVFDFLEKNKYCDMPSLFNILQEDKLRVIVYPIYEEWSDIGHLEDYHNANSL